MVDEIALIRKNKYRMDSRTTETLSFHDSLNLINTYDKIKNSKLSDDIIARSLDEEQQCSTVEKLYW